MTVKSPARDERGAVLEDSWRIPAQCDKADALDKSDIAAVSATVINDMTCDELVRMIRVANLPALLHSALDQHLPFYDRTMLMRLAHLAQRCCRTQGPAWECGHR